MLKILILKKNVKMIRKILNNLECKIKNFKNIKFGLNIKYSFLFGIILDKLNIDINNLPASNNENVYSFAIGIFILSLICLLNFINVVGYLISIVLIKKYDVENKFPKFKKIIRYFENTSLIIVIFEGIICLSTLIIIVVVSLLEIISN